MATKPKTNKSLYMALAVVVIGITLWVLFNPAIVQLIVGVTNQMPGAQPNPDTNRTIVDRKSVV